MALFFDNFQQYSHDGAASSSDSFTVGGSSAIVLVGILTTDARTISSITCAGVTMTLISSSSNFQSQGLDVFFYYALNVGSGSKTIAITLNSAAATYKVNVASYLGALQLAPDQTPAPTSNLNNTTLSQSLTTTRYNEWIIGLSVVGSTLSSVTNGISRATGAANPNFASIDSNGLVTPAGSYSLASVQSASNTYAVILLASFVAPITSSLSETQSSTDSLSGIRKRFTTLSETISTSDAVKNNLNRWRKESIHTGTWTTESKSI